MHQLLMARGVLFAGIAAGLVIGLMARGSAARDQPLIEPPLEQPVLGHPLLNRLAGEWVTETVLMKPGMEPVRTPGMSSNRWTSDGRLMECRWIEDGDDAPSGLFVFGFDEQAESGGNFTLRLEHDAGHGGTVRGVHDRSADALMLTGTDFDPESGEKMTVRRVLEFKSRDHVRLRTLARVPLMGEQELARIDFHRKAAGLDDIVKLIPTRAMIKRMNREQLLNELTRIAKLRKEPGHDAGTRHLLQETFTLIMQQIRKNTPSPGRNRKPVRDDPVAEGAGFEPRIQPLRLAKSFMNPASASQPRAGNAL